MLRTTRSKGFHREFAQATARDIVNVKIKKMGTSANEWIKDFETVGTEIGQF